MKVKQPSFMKSKAYKRIVKELGEMPKCIVTPLEQSPEDKKKAKMMQKLMNYMFETNSNEFTTKYYAYMRRKQKEWLQDEIRGLHDRTTAIDNAIKVYWSKTTSKE